MKTRLLHILLIMGAIFCISHFTGMNTSAQEIGSPYEYPEGTIEVPEGTGISIGDDEKTVTIEDCPVEIKEGDTFVIYLQDLPVGYKAESASKENNDLVVEVEKADPSVYMLLDEEGDVELTSEMYEFAPARNVSYAVAGGKSDDFFDVDKDVSFKDGTLLMKVSMGGAEIQASLSNMHIGHQAQDGSISLGLSGDWRVKTTQSLSDDSLADLPLGEMRIKGIGKITLSLSLSKSMNLECNLAGTFNVGIGATQDGDGSASRGFTVNEKNITGKGEMSVSLKMTAGVDVLIAAADLYVDIGAETDYQRKTTIDPNTDKTTDCDNFRFYLFATMGAEAKYYSILTGKMTSLPPKEFWSIDGSNSQYKIDLHFENGQLVDRCTQGMVIPETEHGGFDVDFSGTILSDNRERIVETDIELPWDMTVDQDLTLSDGTLNLNGHTLTIEGDLIQSDGTLVIGEGTLIVKGDYRIQTKEDEGYGDSSGSLKISNSNGTINIDGNLVIQSTADDHVLTAGTINIKGNIEQMNPKEGVTTFNSGGSCNINLTEENAHSIRFEDADNNSIGWLTLQNNADVEGDINLGRMDLNGHMLTINGNMRSSGRIDLQDRDPEPEVFTVTEDLTISDDLIVESGTRFRGMNLSGHQMTVNGDMISTSDINLEGGTLKVTGTLYQQGGTMTVNTGKLDIGGNYYLAGEGSNFEEGHEVYKSCASYLNMTNENDEVRVGGDFATAALYTNSLTSGTMYIGGDFRQATTNDAYNFNASGSHKVVFNGNERQAIRFDSNSSGFQDVRFENPDIELKGKALRGFTLKDDISLMLSTRELNMYGTMDLNGHSIGIGTIEGDFTVSGGIVDLKGKDVEIKGDLISSGSLRLSGAELKVTGDLIATSNIDIGGGNLKVTGTLYQQGGTMTVNTGKLDIGGNYYLAGEGSSFEEGHEVYKTCNGYLNMTNENDEVRVGGDFATAASYSSSLTAGTMYIGGDFRQATTNDAYNFNASGSHKVVFNGNERQAIRFDSNSSGFQDVRFENPDIELKGKALRGFTLKDDISLTLSTRELNMYGTMDLNGHSIGTGTIEGDFTMSGGTVDLKGTDIEIKGDLIATSNIDIGGGNLKVTGTLYQQGGTMTVNTGKLDIGGNYYLAGEGSNFEEGHEVYKSCASYLNMTNENDEVRVGGDFATAALYTNSLTSGRMYIGGDFRQAMTNSANNFNASGSHKVVLNGDNIQSVTFDSTSSHFNILELTRTRSHYTFNPTPCWITLIEPEKPVLGTPDFVLPAALTVIDEEAFEGIKANIVYIPDTCTEIGAHAFCNSEIKQIRIPADCMLGKDVFDGCNDIIIFGTAGSAAQDYCVTHDNCEFVEE